ncbi:hypothetical protein P691DRAFT_807777, partial [Macrolepiota fuliginosa MF-IS2]
MSHLPAPLDIANNLPQEILNLVVYHARFDHNSLLNLCLTSPFFHHEAQRHLYYELRIANDGRPAIGPSRALTVDVAKAIQLFSTLTQYNTALARHVQILYHCVIPQGACSEYWTLMNKSLILMYNLKKLTLYRRIPPCIFEGCTSFQLRNIECSHPCVDPSFRTAFLDFLATQPNIKSLFMAWDPDIPFPTTHCRNLTSLAGDRCTIEQVLPGREFTIKKLTWVPAREEDPGVNIIASRLSRIHVLSLGGYHVRPNLISLVPYLRSLQILRLIGVAPNVCHFRLLCNLPTTH